MTTTKVLILIAIAATLSACGDFEWFPKVVDTTPPTVSAFIAGKPIFNNGTTHVALPSSVTFTTTEPATIYYTTSGLEPTTASASVVTTANSAAGPSISVTDTILKFFGIDSLSNASAIQTGRIKTL